MTAPRLAALEALVTKVDRSGRLGQVLLGVESGDGALRYRHGSSTQPYFVASATKLFVTVLLAKLRQAGRLDWDAPFAGLVGDLDVGRLHVWRGVDVTPTITVRQLMAHTSGLPDYFEGKRSDGPSTFERARAADLGWSVHDVVRWSRDAQRPHFAPGTGRRALYSDTNYQLLGALIEHQYGASFASVVASEVCAPLGLADTWCFTPETLGRYAEISPLRLGADRLEIPRAMASVGADGGIVSTVDDSLRFVRALFGGQLVERAILDELQATWRRVFFPLEYGTGLMRFRVPWVFSPFKRFAPVVGHSGASGALMFWCPEWDLFVAGTVNQVARRSSSFELMLRALALAHG